MATISDQLANIKPMGQMMFWDEMVRLGYRDLLLRDVLLGEVMMMIVQQRDMALRELYELKKRLPPEGD